MTYEEKMIQKLYEMLEKAKGDDEKVLAWAIFQLERMYDIKIKDGE